MTKPQGSQKVMNEENSDQGQESMGTESEESKVVETTEETTDNQGTEDEGQSNKEGEVSEESEPKLYEDAFGNKLTADEMHAEYQKAISGYGKVAAEAKKYREAEAARKAEAEAVARKTSQDVLKDVPADVQEVIVTLSKKVIEQQMKDLEEQNRQKEEQRIKDEADARFQAKLSDLEKKFDGKNPDLVGIPKFDGKAILREMQKEDNQVFDPELFFMLKHQAKFLDLEVRKALKAQSGGNRTESTGTTASSDRGTKSTGTTPKTIREASQAFLNRAASINSD